MSEWLAYFICVLLMGLSKGGVKGLGSVSIPVMAVLFDAKMSTGLVLPFLIAGDLMAVPYYGKHANWKHFFKLLPWILIGLLFGAWYGEYVSAATFKNVMSIVISLCLVLLCWFEFKAVKFVPDFWWFAAIMGIGVGFTTMVGNMAGAFVTLYMLSMRLDKYTFIGTVAWLFLVVNLLKVPLHIYYWETMDLSSISLNLIMLPSLILGFFIGTRIVHKLNEKLFRKVVLILAILAVLILFFK